MKALIIEDEPQAQAELKRIVKKADPSIKIVDMLSTVEDSVEWLKENEEPDLIFMDIQLSDGLSFSIFEQVKISAPIIFTTAYDQHAIQAFKLNSIDYLLKPIELDGLKKTLIKLQSFKDVLASKSAGLNESLVEQLVRGKSNYKSRFLIKQGESIRYISIEQIAYFNSSSEITFIITKEKKKYAIDYTLDDLIKLLDPSTFFRISRKYIASIDSVEVVTKHFNSRLKVMLKPETVDEILVSRVRVSEFLNWMEK